MEFQILIAVYATLFIGSPLITLLHETGHAVAYLVLTKPENIEIYVGSYGDKKNSIKIKAGKFIYYIKRSFPFVRGIGQCRSSEAEGNYISAIIISFAGPVFTLLIALVVAGVVAVAGTKDIFLTIICYVFFGLSALSLISNLIPREIKTTAGILASDGKQILFKLRLKKQLNNYISASMFFAEKDYEKAIVNYKEVLGSLPGEKDTMRRLIRVLVITEQFDEAETYLKRLDEITELSNDDLINKGYIQAKRKQHHEAIGTLNEVLKKERNNLIALNNIGSSLIQQKAFEVAKRVLERAIKINPDFAYPYANLGFVKLEEGDLDKGKILIDKCIALDADCADAYKGLAIYYIKTKNIALAEFNMQKALTLDKTIDLKDCEEELEKLKA